MKDRWEGASFPRPEGRNQIDESGARGKMKEMEVSDGLGVGLRFSSLLVMSHLEIASIKSIHISTFLWFKIILSTK